MYMFKRISAVLLCAVLALGLFAACGPKEIEAEETTPVNAEEFTTREEITSEEDSIPEETTTAAEDIPTTEAPATEAPAPTTEDAAVTATEAPATTAETTTTTAKAEKTPDQMNKKELVQYWNDSVNAVRAAKPAIAQLEVKKIDSFKSSIAGGILDGLLNGVIKSMMPGNPENKELKKGDENYNNGKGLYIFGPKKLCEVKESDVSSISAKKDGANYVVTLTLGKTTNPMNDGKDSYSRVMGVATQQEIANDLAEQSLTVDPKNLEMVYNSGKASMTVNDKGQIIAAHTELKVDVDATGAKMSIFTFDAVVYQSTTEDYILTY